MFFNTKPYIQFIVENYDELKSPFPFILLTNSYQSSIPYSCIIPFKTTNEYISVLISTIFTQIIVNNIDSCTIDDKCIFGDKVSSDKSTVPNIPNIQSNKLLCYGYKVYSLFHSGFANILFQLCAGVSLAVRYGYQLGVCEWGVNYRQVGTMFVDDINNYFMYEKPVFDDSTLFFGLKNFPYIYFDTPIQKNIALDGYLQNFKYVLPFEKLWQHLLQVPDDFKIEHDTVNTYYLHLRYGDYVNNSYHFIDLSDRIKNIVKVITQKNNKAKFLVMSDDIHLAKENISNFIQDDIPYEFYENKDILNTLYMMSKCEGGICSNSTFSLWGGILNTNANKIIYIPKMWLPTVEGNEKDIADAFKAPWLEYY